MTTTTILIVSAIASAFMLFGGVLAWGDYQSCEATRDQNASPEPAKSPAAMTAIKHRAA